jgi:hypothetical protein
MEGRLKRPATLFGYLLFLVPASALKRARRLAAKLAFPLRMDARCSGDSTVFVCACGCFTSDFMTILLIIPPSPCGILVKSATLSGVCAVLGVSYFNIPSCLR